ncbi:MAG: flagellar biosynthetic protein FliO [Chlamydiales bacterium]|nr:flagellar biosynthetic protein FliO [Chlamydiales bacterium]
MAAPSEQAEPPPIHQEELQVPTEDMGIPTGPVSYETVFTKMIITLIGLVLFVILTIWVLRKIGQGRFRGFGSHRSIEILEKRPLSPKTMLYLVCLEGKKILMAESQLEVKKLISIDSSSEEAED